MVSAAAAAASRRRARAGGGEGDDDKVDASEVRWLISYSDYMMQLVCLFILLFAVSSVEKQKLEAVAEGARKFLGFRLEQRKYSPQGPRKPDVKDAWPATAGETTETMGLYYGLQSRIPNIDSQRLQEGIKIVVKDVTFNEGSAELPKALIPALDAVADGMKAHPATRVEIRGHVSVQPKDAVQGLSQREGWRLLSFQRATAVEDYLLREEGRIKPARVRVTACSSNEPANPAARETPEGSDADRRVEIVVTEEHVR